MFTLVMSLREAVSCLTIRAIWKELGTEIFTCYIKETFLYLTELVYFVFSVNHNCYEL